MPEKSTASGILMLVGKTESPSVVLGSVELGAVGLVSDIPEKVTIP